MKNQISAKIVKPSIVLVAGLMLTFNVMAEKSSAETRTPAETVEIKSAQQEEKATSKDNLKKKAEVKRPFHHNGNLQGEP